MHAALADLLEVLADGGERRRQVARERDVVEADDARLAGEPERSSSADVLARGADHHVDLAGLHDPAEISAGAQPSTYLHPLLGGNSGGVSSIDPTPMFPFGHGLSYTAFGYSDFAVSADEVPTDGEVYVACVVGNEGERAGAEVVQLYLADPVAQVTRPVIELAGFARVPLQPGERARVTFTLHADRTSFTGADLSRIVEPGEVRVMVGASSEDIRGEGTLRLTGDPRVVGHDRVLTTPWVIEPRPRS